MVNCKVFAAYKNNIVFLFVYLQLLIECNAKIMKKIIFIICVSILQSCSTSRMNVDNQFVKQEILTYKRIGDDYRLRNLLRMFVILKMTNSAYEIYTESGEGIMGKFSLRNDTITLYHEYQLGYSDNAINVTKLNGKDTTSEFYPTKFIIKKDSLIDITNYQDVPEYPAEFRRPKENYILVK